MNQVASQYPALPMPQNVWLHGVLMLVLVLLMNLAQMVLVACALLQFLWMLFTRQRNGRLAEVGTKVGHWLALTASVLRGSSDERPFPWSAWRYSCGLALMCRAREAA